MPNLLLTMWDTIKSSNIGILVAAGLGMFAVIGGLSMLSYHYIEECQRVLEEEFPELCRKLRVMLPDEKFRRVGQSMAAASLPEV